MLAYNLIYFRFCLIYLFIFYYKANYLEGLFSAGHSGAFFWLKLKNLKIAEWMKKSMNLH